MFIEFSTLKIPVIDEEVNYLANTNTRLDTPFYITYIVYEECPCVRKPILCTGT